MIREDGCARRILAGVLLTLSISGALAADKADKKVPEPSPAAAPATASTPATKPLAGPQPQQTPQAPNASNGQSVSQPVPAPTTPPASVTPPPPVQPAINPVSPPSGQESRSLTDIPSTVLPLLARSLSQTLGLTSLTDEEYDALKRGLPVFPQLGSDAKASERFSQLRQIRSKTTQLIAQTQVDATTLQVTVDTLRADLQVQEGTVASLKQAIDSLGYPVLIQNGSVSSMEPPQSPDEIERQKQIYERQIKTAQGLLDDLRPKLAAAEAKLEQSKKNALYLQVLLNRIDEAITELLIPESDQSQFKSRLSFYYAVIIGGLILAFFVLCLMDKKVRRAIFSGQAGIQFITLFSLVIAIILFGIVGILEAKELSALLGGISGYILGRTTSERQGTGNQEPVPAVNEMEGIGVAFTAPNRTADANGGFSGFIPGERIEIRGSQRNNGQFTIVTVTNTEMTLNGAPIVDEVAGARVKIKVIS